MMLLLNDNEIPTQNNIFLYLCFYSASIKILIKMAQVKIDFVVNRKYIDAGETCRVRGDCGESQLQVDAAREVEDTTTGSKTNTRNKDTKTQLQVQDKHKKIQNMST